MKKRKKNAMSWQETFAEIAFHDLCAANLNNDFASLYFSLFFLKIILRCKCIISVIYYIPHSPVCIICKYVSNVGFRNTQVASTIPAAVQHYYLEQGKTLIA